MCMCEWGKAHCRVGEETLQHPDGGREDWLGLGGESLAVSLISSCSCIVLEIF